MQEPDATAGAATDAAGAEPRAGWAARSPLAFGGVMVVLIFALKLLVSPLAIDAGGADTTGPLFENPLFLIPLSFLFLPVETFLGQAFPIWVLQRRKITRWPVLCLVSAVVFGLFHLEAGAGAFFFGLASGLVLSFCWLSWRPRSLSMAFWGTTAVHAAHNLVAISLYVVGMLFG
jgi:membrane protease YdiL (CAAX protease family)